MYRVLAAALAIALLLLMPGPGWAQPANTPATAATQPVPGAAPAVPAEPAAPASVAGLCQCVFRQALPPDAPEMTRLTLNCVGGEDQCMSSCGNRPTYAFVPAAAYSCPAPLPQAVGPVAANTR
jgi:hypothetical protein